tara:strand:+ start:31 stop:393 length:363 start_codon:yes stop_codon:yes gene_type:complete
MGWTKIGECGVDSGQIIVVDPCYVISDESDQDKFAESKDYNDLDATYDELLRAYNKDNENANTIEFKGGVVTHTGYGDGCYDVFIKTIKDGQWGERVSALKIVFIPKGDDSYDDDEEEED